MHIYRYAPSHAICPDTNHHHRHPTVRVCTRPQAPAIAIDLRDKDALRLADETIFRVRRVVPLSEPLIDDFVLDLKALAAEMELKGQYKCLPEIFTISTISKRYIDVVVYFI